MVDYIPSDTSMERKGLIQSENVDTFQIDVSTMEMAQEVLPQSIQSFKDVEKDEGQQRGHKLPDSFCEGRELEAAPKSEEKKLFSPTDDVCWIHHLECVRSSGDPINGLILSIVR